MGNLILTWLAVLVPLLFLAWIIDNSSGGYVTKIFSKKQKYNSGQRSSSELISELEERLSRLQKAEHDITKQRDELRCELDQAHALIARLRSELDKSLANRSRNSAASAKEASADRAKFQRVKRVFAERFHPDRTTGGHIDRLVREEVFKEFWAELERIERG